jgi:hypothetical protein
MGWLFAVALGLHRGTPGAVVASLLPIVVGHAAAVAVVLVAALVFGSVTDEAFIARSAGIVLVAWALWHVAYGHRRRVRIGMQAGLAALAVWSFLMATAHGAGLMLLPVVLPLCLSRGPAVELTASGSMMTGLAALGVHTAAMLAVIAAVSLLVYRFVGLAFLRRGWINLDLVWSAALTASGAVLLAH